jgi:ADP-ribosylglycohydrolase
MMISRKKLIDDKDLRHDKSLGCLIGLAIGDTLGELARSEYYHERYGVTMNLYGSSESTDDTEFALLTAKIIIASNGNITEKAVYDAWMKYVVDEGIKKKTGVVSHGAMENLRRGIKPPLTGHDNCNAWDDGAAMRIAPIGIVCAGDPDRAATMAEVDAQISHSYDGIWGAQAVAASVAVAMVDGTVDEIVEAGLKQIPHDSWLGRSCKRAMDICEEEKTLKGSWERLHDELWTPVRASCPEAISQMYALLKLTGDRGFKDSVIAASNFGRDADTLGAIVGAITGAKYGVKDIPPEWIETTRRPRGIALSFAALEDIVDLANELANLIR